MVSVNGMVWLDHGHEEDMARPKKTDTAAASETLAAGPLDHKAEMERRRKAAALACRKHDDAWESIAATLADNYDYVERIRDDAVELKRAAAAGGKKLRGNRVAKPAHLLLRLIYPEKVRQRISEWAAPLEIGHKLGWTAEELRTALLTTPTKKFKKTFDPPPPKDIPEDDDTENDADEANAEAEAADAEEAADESDIPDGTLAVITVPGAKGYTGRVMCVGLALGDGRIAITHWKRRFDDDDDPEFGEGKATPEVPITTNPPTEQSEPAGADGCGDGTPLAPNPTEPPPAAAAPIPSPPHDGGNETSAGCLHSSTIIQHSDAVNEAAAAHVPDLVAVLAVDETAIVMGTIDAAICDAFRTEERFDGIRSGRNWPVSVEITADNGVPSLAISVAGRSKPFGPFRLPGHATSDWDCGPTRVRATVSALVFVNALQRLSAGPTAKISERGVKGAKSNIDTSNAPAITKLASKKGNSIVTSAGNSVWLVNERLAIELGQTVPEPSYCWAAVAA